MSESAALFRRDRVILGAGLLAVALLAWAWLISEAHRMNVSGVCECMRMKMGGPDNSTWPAATLLPLFLMWGVMMVAMMLPSALPMVLTFAAVTRNRQRLGRPYVPTMVFVSGYVAIWSVFSAVAAVGQWLLHRHALLSPSMATTSAILGGALLIGAGVFQFTPLKRSCLTRCRGTLEFILTRWREGLFVAGVMNILWVAALTLLVCLEKILPTRARVSFASGIVLTGWGLFILGSRYFALVAFWPN